MAVSWSNLPSELWSIVFKHVQSMKTVAECRLVCKTLDPLAERAMFSKSLSVSGEERITRFYNRLQEKPSLRYYIRSLSLGGVMDRRRPFNEDLFRLVMNPNIVSLDGWFDETALNNLLNAVKESGEQCEKLESLITWERELNGGDSYLNAQLYFKTSLQELRLSMHTPHTPIYQTVVDHLDQFSNLKRLVLSYSDRHILPELERMLRQCQHLESIDMIDVSFRETPWISKDDLKQWMISNVQPSSSLQIAYVDQNPHPHLVEYLMFKCPKMRNVTLSNAFTDDHGTISRIVDVVKNVDTLNLNYWWLDSATDVEHVLSTLKSENNLVILRPCSLDYAMGYLTCLDAKKIMEGNTTHFMISVSEFEFSTMFNRIINHIASFSDLKVDYVDEDAMLIDSGTTHQATTTVRRMIDIMSVAKDVSFTCTYISIPPSSVNLLPFQQLETLKICAAVIDQTVLTAISRASPRLESLTLSSCILNPAYPQHY